jgi:hypothetical protein
MPEKSAIQSFPLLHLPPKGRQVQQKMVVVFNLPQAKTLG